MLDRHILKGYCSYMEIRVLKYFLAVAREGSITGAAYPHKAIAGTGKRTEAKAFNKGKTQSDAYA